MNRKTSKKINNRLTTDIHRVLNHWSNDNVRYGMRNNPRHYGVPFQQTDTYTSKLLFVLDILNSNKLPGGR